MTVHSPLSRARTQKLRTSSSRHRRSVAKTVTRGLAAVAIVSVAGTTALAGIGALLAASIRARSETRSIVSVTLPLERAAWTPPAGGMAIPSAAVANEFSVSTAAPAEIAARNSTGASERAADPPDTGSIPTSSFKLASLDVASAVRVERAPRLDAPDPLPLPLPRPRPQLAALPPLKDLGIQAQEDARSSRTAIYDITGQVVHLPSGERLEAHSGLGDLMDDPRYVREINRGATPPNTYALTLRESLFHGVQAIRLTPVSGSTMFNRDGILAHSYMLGPSGQSNGCVSVKDYPKFLRAYMRGEIDRIVVVPRLTKPPEVVAREAVRSPVKAL